MPLNCVINNVSCLFLTKDRLRVVKQCLSSLEYLLSTNNVKEWIILDNNSIDGTNDYLMHKYEKNPKVKVILSSENTGVAGGRNILMSEAQGDAFLILDSDVYDRKKSFLPILIQTLATQEAGIVGVHGAHIKPDWSWVDSGQTPGIVDGITGYCQLFQRDIYDGGARWDTAFDPYWLSDTDFCMDIRHRFGLRSVIANIQSKSLKHTWGKTCSGSEGRRQVLWKYFVDKWRDKHANLTNGSCLLQ